MSQQTLDDTPCAESILQRLVGVAAESPELRESQFLERAAWNELQLFHAIVDAARDYAIFMVDPDGFVITWNAGALRSLGYRREEIIGRHISRFYAPEALQQQRPEQDLELALAEGRFEQQGWRVRKDGSRFWAHVIIAPMRDEAGQLVGYSHATRDLTEQKRIDSQLKANSEALDRIKRDLESLTHVASHDLKEPLRMVASYTALLAEEFAGKFDSEGDKYIHFAVDGAKRMQSLIDDLLRFLRVGKEGRRRQQIDFQQLAKNVAESLETTIRLQGADVRFGTLPTISGDPALLGQLLQQLISNAIKFHGPAAPAVQISCHLQDGEWLFAVEDNGIGIAPAFHERVFDLFRRLHRGERYQGTGIGLPICRRIIELHGGRIWLQSEQGKGSTFFFALPVENASHPNQTEVAAT